MQWETVIGLEIHAQLATKSKIFSAASTQFGAEPNAQAVAVDLGMPGVLPVLNAQAVRMAVMFGLAVDAQIGMRSIFARKNYFYPDLPKGYQISQFEAPIVGPGAVDIVLSDGTSKVIRITRAHLEEDAGKSVHDLFPGRTAVDLNRAGTPLLEIVSEPDLRSASEAVAYAKQIHTLVRYLGICDGNMQEGSFRCDANISVRPMGQQELGTRAEIKNVNSFRFLERAIEFEVERQIELISSGGKVVQETRLYDADQDETRSMRSKEDAEDYRYFPDPDLLPVVIDPADIERWRAELPELPQAREARYRDAQINAADIALLIQDPALANYFDAAVELSGNAKTCVSWVVNELLGRLDKAALSLAESPVDSRQFGALVARVADGTLSAKLGRQVLDALWAGEGTDVDAIIDARGLRQVSDDGALDEWVAQTIEANPSQVADFLAGKDKLLGYLVGQAMKLSKGKANPGQLSERLKQRLARGD